MRYTAVLILSLIFGVGSSESVSAQHADPLRIDAEVYAELDEALRLLKRSAELNPQDPFTHYFIALVYQRQFSIWFKRYQALVSAGREGGDEMQRVLSEMERLKDLLEDTDMLIDPSDDPHRLRPRDFVDPRPPTRRGECEPARSAA